MTILNSLTTILFSEVSRWVFYAGVLAYPVVWMLALLFSRADFLGPRDPRTLLDKEYKAFGAWALAFALHMALVLGITLWFFVPFVYGMAQGQWLFFAPSLLVLFIDAALISYHVRCRRKCA
jgi:hypothetical protein